MGLAWGRGERLWENLRVSRFPVGLSQLSVATRPTMGLKKLREAVVVAGFLNYVFMDLHNSLSDGVLLFKSTIWGLWKGRRGWRSTEGEERGKLKT